MKGLTAKQQNVLDYIMEFAELEGMAPTINEIAEHFSINSTTAFSIFVHCSVKSISPVRRKRVAWRWSMPNPPGIFP